MQLTLAALEHRIETHTNEGRPMSVHGALADDYCQQGPSSSP